MNATARAHALIDTISSKKIRIRIIVDTTGAQPKSDRFNCNDSGQGATKMEHRDNKRMALAVVATLIAVLATGCSSSGETVDDDPTEAEKPERARYGNLETEGLDVEKVDLDGSDQPDQWTFSDEDGQVVRVERDMNFDGRVNLWEHYEHGELVEEEMSLDSADQVDVVVFYSDGEMTRQKMASGFDGTFAIEKIYDSGGELLRVERDTSSDGQVDVWDYYEDGHRVRIGWDTTGDGQPDTFEQRD